MLKSLELISLLFFWGLIHSILASLPIKNFIKNRFGESVSLYYRIAYNIIAVISFIPIIGLLFFLTDSQLYSISKPWVFFTLIIQFFSLVIMVIGLKQTGTLEFLGLHVFRGEREPMAQKLNENGLYKFVRHPLYSAGLVLLWCSPVMTTNYLIISICLSIYIIFGAIIEERKLVVEFGDDYRDYRKKVPMLIPRLKWNKKK